MEATGYLPLQFFFGNPTAAHSLAGKWYLFGRFLAPSSSNFPTSILATSHFSSPSQFLRPCLPSITVSRDCPNGICVTNQPQAELVLEPKESITFPVQNDNEQHCQCEHGQKSPSEDRRHHNIRLRKLILAALLVLLTLGGLLVWICVNWHGRSTWEVDSLVKRNFVYQHPVGQYSSTLFFNTYRS